MNCIECGSELDLRREPYRYEDCGLKGVVLQDTEVRKCLKCGEEEVVIPAIAGLHAVLAMAIIRRKTRLNGDEVRFLRKYIGWSGANFAAHMGVEPGTVSRWENGSAPIGSTADRLLRLAVVSVKQIGDYSVDELVGILDEDPPSQTRIRLSHDSLAVWHEDAACM
ncbi:MAG TPA: type II TA system antitoxin MqsA family protein [Polyangiaceae bacterium]